MDSDIELMLEFAGGNTSAFEQILKKYKDMVINLAYRFVQNYPEAEDIAQEVFLKIYQSAVNYKPSAKLSTWIYRITANLSLNYLRSKKHSATVPWEENLEITDTSTPEEDLAKKELVRRVREALDLLPENQKLAVILRRYENLSYQEIAEVIGISRAAVDSLIQRAKENLKKELESYIK